MHNKKHKKRKVVVAVDQTEKVVYQNSLVTISETSNGYYFEICNKVFTADIAEAVSYLMRNPMWRSETFWHLPVPAMSDVDAMKSLYWLSGGDELWNNPVYNVKWSDYANTFASTFNTDVEYLLDADTLADVRTNITRHLNLDVMIEFCLQHNII